MWMRLFFYFGLFLLSFYTLSYDFTQFTQELSVKIHNELATQNIPGAAYVVVKGDQIITLETYGFTDQTKSQKIDAHTVFRLASVSKTFAATLTAMLAEEKYLHLSDPVTQYLPELNLGKNGAADQIQLKHLLSHSTGIIPNAYDNLLHENWTMDKIISRFKRIEPICAPELCYGYQNIAFSFIQYAIEANQNKNYSSLLNERLFDPLNMQQASVGIKVFNKGTNIAKPHILAKRHKIGKNPQGKDLYTYDWRESRVNADFYKVAPAAGVNASITDLAQWLIANLGHKPKVLPASLIKELTTPRIQTKKALRQKYWKTHLIDAHYGYGWRIYKLKQQSIIFHSGWVAGFVANLAYSPTLDMGFALLINAESNAINKLSSQFWINAQQFIPSSRI